jgi:hypothetical protein
VTTTLLVSVQVQKWVMRDVPLTVVFRKLLMYSVNVCEGRRRRKKKKKNLSKVVFYEGRTFNIARIVITGT